MRPAPRCRRRLALTEHAAPPRCSDAVNEVSIHALVHTFYERVRADAVLGPVFEARIADWSPHLSKMIDFWSSAMLRSGRYSGRPIDAHLALPGLTARHFERWLALFAQTTAELFPAPDAALFTEMAGRMAQAMSVRIGLGEVRLPCADEPAHRMGMV